MIRRGGCGLHTSERPQSEMGYVDDDPAGRGVIIPPPNEAGDVRFEGVRWPRPLSSQAREMTAREKPGSGMTYQESVMRGNKPEGVTWPANKWSLQRALGLPNSQMVPGPEEWDGRL
jgi:hypothetical protein